MHTASMFATLENVVPLFSKSDHKAVGIVEWGLRSAMGV